MNRVSMLSKILTDDLKLQRYHEDVAQAKVRLNEVQLLESRLLLDKLTLQAKEEEMSRHLELLRRNNYKKSSSSSSSSSSGRRGGGGEDENDKNENAESH